MTKERKNKGRFAGIPMFVMESEAYVTLPPLAKCLLYELAAQYNSRNNGYLSLTRSDLKVRGYPSTNSNTKAINALVDANLITRTRDGTLTTGGKVCHLYALNWYPSDERVDKPFESEFLFKGSFQVWLSDKSKAVKILAR